MSDLISRQAAIDAIEQMQMPIMRSEFPEEQFVFTGMSEALRAIKELPSAQQWIPCSESLPEDYTDVLVWFEYFRYGNYNCLYQMYGIGSYSSEYDSWLINQETGWNELKVFAWMPLPVPYKGKQE